MTDDRPDGWKPLWGILISAGGAALYAAVAFLIATLIRQLQPVGDAWPVYSASAFTILQCLVLFLLVPLVAARAARRVTEPNQWATWFRAGRSAMWAVVLGGAAWLAILYVKRDLLLGFGSVNPPCGGYAGIVTLVLATMVVAGMLLGLMAARLFVRPHLHARLAFARALKVSTIWFGNICLLPIVEALRSMTEETQKGHAQSAAQLIGKIFGCLEVGLARGRRGDIEIGASLYRAEWTGTGTGAKPMRVALEQHSTQAELRLKGEARCEEALLFVLRSCIRRNRDLICVEDTEHASVEQETADGTPGWKLPLRFLAERGFRSFAALTVPLPNRREGLLVVWASRRMFFVSADTDMLRSLRWLFALAVALTPGWGVDL